jgi:plasmid maintenance system killer protein
LLRKSLIVNQKGEKVCRLRLRWLDDVENDLRVMKIKRWRKKAQNREDWASVIKEAKVLKGQ